MKKTIRVESNDPNNPVIKLTLIANVKEELSVEPMTIYFRDMKPGERRSEKVQLKNVSKKKLEILPIELKDSMVTVEPVNHPPESPVELNPNEALSLLVSFQHTFSSPRFTKQVDIKYNGGEVADAYFKLISMQEKTTIKNEPEIAPPTSGSEKDPNKTEQEPLDTLPSNETLEQGSGQTPPALQPPAKKIDTEESDQ